MGSPFEDMARSIAFAGAGATPTVPHWVMDAAEEICRESKGMLSCIAVERIILAHAPQPTPDSGLVEAARAVVERWDTPSWKDAGPTADVMNRLRAALARHEGDKA